MIYFTRHGESVANVADRFLQARPEDADRLLAALTQPPVVLHGQVGHDGPLARG